MKFTIYKYTCPENKVYIGITINAENRKESHRKSENSKRSGTKFVKAIKKFGYSNLKYEEIEYPSTVEEMREREKYWITFYDSLNTGYNMNLGGGWTRKFEYSAKKIERIIQLLKEDQLTLEQIATEVKVSKGWISAIKRGKARNSEVIQRTNRQSQKGSSNPASKLTEAQVTEILSQLSQGVPRRELQQKYNVSKTLIQMIATQRSWDGVSTDYQYKPKELNGNAKLTPEIVRNIKIDLQTMSQLDVSAKYGISRSTVQQIKYEKTWKNVSI